MVLDNYALTTIVVLGSAKTVWSDVKVVLHVEEDSVQ